MNRQILKLKLKELDINSNQYSLYGDLIPDSVVLYENYYHWEVFYLDERGIRNEERVFTKEEDACLYIYKLFRESKMIQDKYKLK